MMRSLLTIACFLYLLPCVPAQTDSTLLTPDAFLAAVADNHPLALAAGLRLDEARFQRMQARGAFDPKFFLDFDNKRYDGSEYYDLFYSGVKIPTWYGLSLEASYERNSGVFQNPENEVPDDGLWGAGLSANLGRGLFIDERRAQLQQARLAQGRAEAERLYLLNDLLYDAGQAYWEWFRAYHALQTYEAAVDLAQFRFRGVRQNAIIGESAAIDTLEAGIQVQNRQLSLADARLELANAAALVSIFFVARRHHPPRTGGQHLPAAAEFRRYPAGRR